MTAQELAEFRFVARLVKWVLGVIVAMAFAAGVWVTNLQGAAAAVPPLRSEVAGLRREVSEFREAMADLVLLQCAQPGLSGVEQRICAKYEPRMPR